MRTKTNATKKQSPANGQRDKGALRLIAKDGETQDKLLAQAALRPSVQGSLTVKQFCKAFSGSLELDLSEVTEELARQANAARQGDLGRMEEILATQAHTLDTIFNELARRAVLNMGQYVDAVDRYMRLALRAQNQCRSTAETLALMKNPQPTTFVKQANIANNQQINQDGAGRPREFCDQYAHAHARTGENEFGTNKLLETDHGERLDSGTASKSVGQDSRLETLAQIDGT